MGVRVEPDDLVWRDRRERWATLPQPRELRLQLEAARSISSVLSDETSALMRTRSHKPGRTNYEPRLKRLKGPDGTGRSKDSHKDEACFVRMKLTLVAPFCSSKGAAAAFLFWRLSKRASRQPKQPFCY